MVNIKVVFRFEELEHSIVSSLSKACHILTLDVKSVAGLVE